MDTYYHQHYPSQGTKLISRALGPGKPSLAVREDNAIQGLGTQSLLPVSWPPAGCSFINFTNSRTKMTSAPRDPAETSCPLQGSESHHHLASPKHFRHGKPRPRPAAGRILSFLQLGLVQKQSQMGCRPALPYFPSI